MYWRSDGTSLSFGSELKALALDPRPDATGRSRRLAPLPDLPVRARAVVDLSGDQQAVAGSLLVWHRGRAERQVLAPGLSPAPAGTLDEEAGDRLRELLIEATRIRLVSERPVGAFLSGGVDSSAVVAAMARSQRSEQVQAPSASASRTGVFDEREYARAVARRYDTDHHELVVTPNRPGLVAALAWHFDEPFADSSAIPSFYLARLSRTQVTVALSGDGGDECFGGSRGICATWP